MESHTFLAASDEVGEFHRLREFNRRAAEAVFPGRSIDFCDQFLVARRVLHQMVKY